MRDTIATALRGLQTGALAVSDKIIDLSLRQEGARPRPGTRQRWRDGLRGERWNAQGRLCIYCRRRLRLGDSHIDHVVPVVQGGSNEWDNLQLLCAGCNIRKGRRSDAEFRYRYRDLLPQRRGQMPARTIRQSEFKRVTAASTDAPSYVRFRSGKYLTPAQKVGTGALVTGISVALAIFVPIYWAFAPNDASILLSVSVILGIAAGVGVRIRAKMTGRDQESDEVE